MAAMAGLEDLLLTLLVLSLTLILGEVLRRGLRNIIPYRQHFLVMEIIFTFQLCFLLKEVELLATVGKQETYVVLTLVYVTVVAHCWSSTCALCNPTTAVQHLMTGHSSFMKTTEKVCCQLLGAIIAWLASSYVHRLALTKVHSSVGPECTSHLHTTLENGAAVEMGLAFLFHSVLHLLPHVQDKYRIHVIAVVYTALVAAGGHLTGAIFNPALAFSLNFFCKGTSIPENICVYWLGPIAGMILSVAVFDHIIPAAKNTYDRIMGRGAEVIEEKID